MPTGVKSSGNRDVCTRRSIDGGETWGNLTVIVPDAGQDTAVFDAVKKTVIVNVLMAQGNGQVSVEALEVQLMHGARDMQSRAMLKSHDVQHYNSMIWHV